MARPRSPVRTRPALALIALLLAGSAPPLLAQEAGKDPVPPGEGMIEQPCPAQTGLWFGHPYVRANDWAWLCRFREDNAKIAPEAAPQAVFIGDSITEGWGRADPAFFDATHANRGISGQTTPQMLLRFMQDVVALHPQVVHIMAGTNDVAGNTGPNRPEDFRNTIRAMTTLAKANGIAVVIASIPPADHFGWNPRLTPAPRIAELNAWLRDFARTNGLVYADYYGALADAGGGLPASFSKDGVHPEAAGYAVMRAIAERAIAEALSQTGRTTTVRRH